ncbi:MAG: hypothetical protein KVP17_000197 [Porospora cf. gigantea B]|nr:MAG: hypothetical protein KVP17_000197 [Porospora cf. gigantea B]
MAVTPLNLTGRLPKIPKGTQDFGPARMNLRGSVLDAVRSVFQKYGAVEIDTPVFELTDTLLGKYGEDQKLIFSLKDQGGEQLALRYDLTVPFARYCAVNKVENIKRFHIGKVYRRDEPQMAKGRYREFYQCDFDIAGKHDSMVADAEVLSVFHELLTTFRPQIGPFEVKLNHRKLLDGMLEVCGVPLHSVRGISSAIDKLDKETWDVVREEMVDKKNLDPQVADRLRPYCCMRGRLGEMLATIEGDELLMGSASVRLAVVDLQALNPLIDDTDFVLDLSLARGLDYYTGLIYEAILVDGGVGSIGAGGRYDKLIGMFSSTDIPAIGVSLGLERIFRILEATFSVSPYEKVTTATTPIRQTQTDVFVCSIGEDLLPHRMRIAQELRNGGIGTEFAFSSKAKLVKQLAKAQTDKVPLVVVVGQDEIDNGTIKLRKMYYGKESNNRDDVVVNRADLVTAVQAVLDEEGSSRTRLQKLVLGIDSV